MRQYRTRSSTEDNLFLPKVKSALLVKRSIKDVGVKVRNEIPCCFTKLKTIKSFFEKLTPYLINKEQNYCCNKHSIITPPGSFLGPKTHECFTYYCIETDM